MAFVPFAKDYAAKVKVKIGRLGRHCCCYSVIVYLHIRETIRIKLMKLLQPFLERKLFAMVSTLCIWNRIGRSD